MKQEIILLENKEQESDFWTTIEKVKQYAETNAALCVFVGTIVITIVSFLIKFLLYLHDWSYNNYFGVSNTYITITDKNGYSFLLDMCGAIVMLLFNALSFYYFKKRKLIKYLISFFCVAFCAFMIFIAAIDENAFISNLGYGIKISGYVALLLTVAAHAPTLCSSASESTSHLFRRFFPQKSKDETSTKNGNKIVRASTKQENFCFLTIVGGISLIIMVAFSLNMGYSQARIKDTFKTISTDDLNAIMANSKEWQKASGGVVVFENNDIFLVCPYNQEQKEIKIKKYIQAQIPKENITITNQTFTKTTVV